MTATSSIEGLDFNSRDCLDFVFDGSGWLEIDASDWHTIGTGKVFGRETLALALGGRSSPLSARMLVAITDFIEAQIDLPLLLVLLPCDLADEEGQQPQLSVFVSEVSRRQSCNMVLCVVLGDLVGPLAILAQLSDVVYYGPRGHISLADSRTSSRIRSAHSVVPTGMLSCMFTTDGAALLAARYLISMTTGTFRSQVVSSEPENSDHVIERLAQSDTSWSLDENRLLQRLADNRNRTVMEFDGSAGLLVSFLAIGGRPVGVLASTAQHSGVLHASDLVRARRFVTLCSRHSIPIIALINSAGVVPDECALASLADLVRAWREIRVTVISVVLRKAIGASAAALMPPFSKVLFWPNASIGFLKDSTVAPHGLQIAEADTRRALIELLWSVQEVSTCRR